MRVSSHKSNPDIQPLALNKPFPLRQAVLRQRQGAACGARRGPGPARRGAGGAPGGVGRLAAPLPRGASASMAEAFGINAAEYAFEIIGIRGLIYWYKGFDVVCGNPAGARGLHGPPGAVPLGRRQGGLRLRALRPPVTPLSAASRGMYGANIGHRAEKPGWHLACAHPQHAMAQKAQQARERLPQAAIPHTCGSMAHTTASFSIKPC